MRTGKFAAESRNGACDAHIACHQADAMCQAIHSDAVDNHHTVPCNVDGASGRASSAQQKPGAEELAASTEPSWNTQNRRPIEQELRYRTGTPMPSSIDRCACHNQGGRSTAANSDRASYSRERTGSRARHAAQLHVAQIPFLLMLLALIRPVGGQSIKTVMGGSIYWHLENDFEETRHVTFTLNTFWDGREVGYLGEGITVIVGREIIMPVAGGSPYASRFGNLKVQMGDETFLIENRFVVISLDGRPPGTTGSPNDGEFDEGHFIIEGRLNVTLKVPEGAYRGNASMVGVLANDQLLRNARYGAGGVVTTIPVNGGLTRCEMAGPSPVPCEVYTTHIPPLIGQNPSPLGFFTTISLPRQEDSDKFYRGKVRNRNSATLAMRPMIWITDKNPGKSNSFMLPAFDRDGDPVKT